MKTNNKSRDALSVAIFAILASIPMSAIAASCNVKAKTTPHSSQTVKDVDGNNNATVVTLDGTNSFINNDDTTSGLKFSWIQASGPAISLINPNTATPTFNAPNVGTAGATLGFTLTVTGCASNKTDSAAATVIVTDNSPSTPSNQPPVASAIVSPSPIYEGDTVTLDGSTSSDPDSDPLTYKWEQIEGIPVTLASDAIDPAIATFTAPTAPYPSGTSLKFKLTVSDGSLTGQKEVIINVEWQNKPPVAKVYCLPSVNERAEMTLDGTGSTDPDDGIISYLWSQTVGGPIADLPNVLSTPLLTFNAPELTSSLTSQTMTFSLEVSDKSGLKSSANCDVSVNDITPPVFDYAPNITAEATASSGSAVNYTNPNANDAFEGPVSVTCDPSSGNTFPLGATVVSCSAEDTAHNKAESNFSITVQDTTPPTLALPSSLAAEATGPSGAAVTYSASALDLVDGSITPSCSPASGSTFALGATTVNCSVTDAHNNTASGSFTVAVQDTTPPTIIVPADIQTGPTNATGAIVNYDGASATDLVDGAVAVSCTPASGSQFVFGDTTVTCSAEDTRNNKGSKSFKVTVNPFTFQGFFAPVDNLPLVNTTKNGSTVPVKWKLQGKDGVEITSTSAVTSTQMQNISCDNLSNALETLVETLATGGTTLRYDSTAMQFVYNWQTPKSPGSCYSLNVKFTDGKVKNAYFKLK